MRQKYYLRGLVVSICAFCAGICAQADNVGGIAGSEPKDVAARPEIILATNGASDYVIVVPDGDDPRDRVKKAADLLQTILEEAAGCKLPVCKEAEAPVDKPHIYLGKTKAAMGAGVPVDKLKEWNFCKRVAGKDLFLAGLDASANITNRDDKEYLGTFKAVTSFLEDEVGVRFLLPGTNGLYVPKLPELAVDAGLNVVATPKIPYCYGRFYGGSGGWRVLSEQRINIANNQLDMVFYACYGGHSYYSAVPVKKYAETHPEYFALIGGKRSPGEKCEHLCISNPEVQELMLKEMEKQLDLGYERVQLAQTDGYRACECDKCKALTAHCRQYDGTGDLPQYLNPEALWIVHRKLAEEMQKRRPGKKVVILSYGPTAKPPKTFKKFPDNVVIEMCRYSFEDFELWKKFPCEKLVYVYNWGTYHRVGFLPKRSPAFAARQLRLFAENNVKGIYKCGFGESFGLEGPVYYVYSKLLFDPSADPQKLADDFYRAAYGKACAPMKAFFDALHERMDFKNSERPVFIEGGANAQDILWERSPEELICYIFSPAAILRMEDSLKQALKMDNDPRVQARMKLVQQEFVYLKNMVSIFTYYRAYRLSGSGAVFGLLEAELDKRNALIDSWFVNERAENDSKGPKWKKKMEDGFAPFAYVDKDALKAGGCLLGTLAAPFTWDMKKMRNMEKEGGQAAGRKPLKAVKAVTPPVIDGVPDDGVWKNIPVEQLGAMDMKVALREKTAFQAAYDEKNIYFAFTCEFAGIKQADFTPCGRDGQCWIMECLEIFLDPLGTRQKKYHFIFNPVANSFYDGRLGFIDDPLHPQFGKEDALWNGDWEYAVRVDEKNGRWTAEVKIPFATLGVSRPAPGAAWTMNVAREHYYQDKATGKSGVQYSVWSPNLDGGGFGDPLGFGALEFE